ncbi:CCT motif family protein [Abeliophyllum distichum]|uniref:CCT motif family protein n=1 Tax=Abeliophyllum distichum TaxID=126358 RepID=A0ABD1TWF8_9LAMI
MSSELFVFDDSFFCDSFSPFTDSPIDTHSHEILQENPNILIQENSLLFDETNSLDQITPTLLSSSPSSTVNLENLSLSHLGNGEYSVKKEEDRIPLDIFGNSIMAQSFLMTSSCRGVITKKKTDMQTRNVLSTERSFMEESNFKVGRYSAKERKERIHRYRAKRALRNFNKTIKYTCRKTLADNRPRIRGRFVRNDEGGEIPKASMFNSFEDDDDLWLDGFLEEEDERIIGEGSFLHRFGSTQYQNYSYQR